MLAHGDNFETDEDTPLDFDLQFSGGSPAYGPEFEIITFPQRGTLSGSGAHRTYTPNPNANGEDSFIFSVTQGAATSTAKAFLTIRPVNDAPVVSDATLSTHRDQSVELAPIVTDIDVPGSTYSRFDYRISTPPLHGAATIIPNQNTPGGALIRYTPAAGYSGPDTFQIVANDAPTLRSPTGAPATNAGGALDSAPATVTVTVADNAAPVAANDLYATPFNQALTISAPGVLGNDSDADGDAISAVLDPRGISYSGAVTLNSNGSFTWTPYSYYTQPATASFRYAAKDAIGRGEWATVTINVTQPVIANAQTLGVPESSSRAITLTGSGTGALTYSIVSQPAKGLLSGVAPNLVYAPFSYYYGADSFVFRVQDASGQSATATISINVTPWADEPFAYSSDIDVEGTAPTTIWLRAFDGDDNALSFSVSAPRNGTLSPIANDGTPWPINMKPYLYQSNSATGEDSFTFTANDGYYTSNTATVRLHVRAPVGAAPVAVGDVYGVARGQTLVVGAPGLTLNDSDAGGAPLRAILDRGPLNAMLFGVAPDGSFTYAGGVSSWHTLYSSDSFTYHVSNGVRNSAPVTVTINIVPIAATPSWVTLETNSVAAVTLQASGPRPLIYETEAPAHGVLSGSAPDLTYTPAPDFWGEDSFRFRVRSGDLVSEWATVTLRVLAPWSVSDATVAVREGESVSFVLPVNDPGRRAQISVLGGPLHGTLSDTVPNLVYTPSKGYVGNDKLTFRAVVGEVTRTGTVSFGIAAVPRAVAQSLHIEQNENLSLTLTGTHAGGASLTFAVTRAPLHGTLSGTAPNLVYRGFDGYFGPDSFEFTASDGTLTSAPAQISINVLYVSLAPVAVADAFETPQNQTLVVAAPGVLSNDSDANGDALTALVKTQPQHGALTLQADGGFSYVPDTGFEGTDSFNYAAFDGILQSAAATVSIRVRAPNRAPTALAQTVKTDQDQQLAIVLSGSDLDGDVLTFETLTLPGYGTLSGAGATRVFVPRAGWIGSTSFTFRAVDPSGAASAAAKISITVRAPNRAPTALAQSVSTLEDYSKKITFTGSDPDRDPLTYQIVSGPQNGTLSGTGSARTYRPTTNFFGADEFSIAVSDGRGGLSAPVVITLTIVPINDAPNWALATSSLGINPNTPLQTVLNFARDISPGNAYENDQTLTFTLTPVNPALFEIAPAISSQGNLTYKVKSGALGSTKISVVLRDDGGIANGGRDTASTRTFTLTIK